jgi:hypothetical protein
VTGEYADACEILQVEEMDLSTTDQTHPADCGGRRTPAAAVRPAMHHPVRTGVAAHAPLYQAKFLEPVRQSRDDGLARPFKCFRQRIVARGLKITAGKQLAAASG